MSTNTAANPIVARGLAEEHKFAFRVAFAASVGFTIGHVLGWDFPFLAPLFAVQLLAGSRSFSLQQAVGFVVLMATGCILSILIAQSFLETPLILATVIGLIVFFAFLMLARANAVPIANVILITISIVPLTAVTSLDSAYTLVNNLIAGSILAVFLVFIAYAFFSASGHVNETGVASAGSEYSPVRVALANSTVLLSLVILFMISGSPVSIVILMTALTILRQPTTAGHGAAWDYFMGNVTGGLTATIAYLLVIWLSSPVFLFLVILLFGLFFGAKISEGSHLASVYSIGLVTFLLVLGIGLAPLPSDSGTVFIERVVNVVVAAAYTIGLASVTHWLFSTMNKDIKL
jgi:hypothetical protein